MEGPLIKEAYGKRKRLGVKMASLLWSLTWCAQLWPTPGPCVVHQLRLGGGLCSPARSLEMSTVSYSSLCLALHDINIS